MGFIPTFSGAKIKYIGRPLEQISRANNVLSQRYKANKASYENQIDFLDNLDVEDRNRIHVENASNKIKDAFGDVISSNDFEHSGNVISEQARALKANKELKGSIQSKALHVAYTKDLDERVKSGKLDSIHANELRAEANATNNQTITVDKDGNVSHLFTTQEVVNDPKINDQIMKLTAKLKASTTLVPGATIKNEGGAWRSVTTNKTINEAEATAAIAKMVKSDPANQAWFAQEKRLADLDKYARANDGTFARDEAGNLIEQPIDYRNKLNSINIDANQLNNYIQQYNKFHDKEDNINLKRMSAEDRNMLFKQIYDSQFVNSKIDSIVKAGVAVVDYNEQKVKIYQDQAYLFNYKQKYLAAAKKKAAVESPTYNVEIINGKTLMPRNTTGIIANNTLFKKQLDNGINQVERTLRVTGAISKTAKLEYNKINGQVYIIDGNSKKPITEVPGGMGLQSYVSHELNDSAFRYQQNQKIFDSAFSGLSEDDQNKYLKYAAENITERGVFDLMDDVPPALLDQMVKEGYITYGESKNGLFRSDDDATFLKPTVDIINRLRESSYGRKAVNNYLSETMVDNDNVVVQRLNQNLKQIFDNSNNNVETGRLITESNDYNTARVNGNFALQRMYDTEGKLISEGASELISSEDLNHINESKDMKIGINFRGGTPKTIYTGTIPIKNDKNKVIGSKPFTLVDNYVDPALLHKYTTNKEERTLAITHVMADFEHTTGYFSRDIEVGQPYKMRIERIGIDANDNYTTDINKAVTSIYVAKELGHAPGKKPIIFTAPDKVQITGLVADYSEKVYNARQPK